MVTADLLKSNKDGGRDLVTEKLCETIQPMKESFTVAFLNCDGISKEHSVASKGIKDERNNQILETMVNKSKIDPKEMSRWW